MSFKFCGLRNKGKDHAIQDQGVFISGFTIHVLKNSCTYELYWSIQCYCTNSFPQYIILFGIHVSKPRYLNNIYPNHNFCVYCLFDNLPPRKQWKLFSPEGITKFMLPSTPVNIYDRNYMLFVLHSIICQLIYITCIP